jgi:hypothetical protein
MPEKFGLHEHTTGKDGVSVGLQRMSFPQSFQQAPACPQTVQSALSPSFAGCLTFAKSTFSQAFPQVLWIDGMKREAC